MVYGRISTCSDKLATTKIVNIIPLDVIPLDIIPLTVFRRFLILTCNSQYHISQKSAFYSTGRYSLCVASKDTVIFRF